MLVGNGAEMQKSFNQNRNLLRKRTFLNLAQARKRRNRWSNKQVDEETKRRFDKLKENADKKAKRMIVSAMIFLAMGFYMFYKLLA